MVLNKDAIKEIINTINTVELEIGKSIIGQKEIVRQTLLGILCGGNILLEGVPGLGKTQLIKTLSKVLDLSFSRIQFTPDLMPADVVGTNMFTQGSSGNGKFEYQQGPIFANLVLADEINRATPKTQSAMLEAMQEQTVTVGTSTYPLPSPYMVLATQNPLEMEGTYPLPEAQLDRFLFKLNVKFPTLTELRNIMDVTINNTGKEPNKVIDANQILNIREIIKQVPIAEPVMEYALKLILATQPESDNCPAITKKYIRYGSSPRGAQAIVLTAKANALLEGRYNVSFDDIDYVALPALRHRISLNFEALSSGYTNDSLIKELLKIIEN